MIEVWLVSLVLVIVIASSKKLNLLVFALLGLILGPLAILIVLAVPEQKNLGTSQPSLQFQIDALKRQLFHLEKRLSDLEGGSLLAKPIEKSSPVEMSIPSPLLKEPISVEKSTFVKPESPFIENKSETLFSESSVASETSVSSEKFEFILGKYWLNRIGIVLFVLGIGLLISYTFHYFSPILKIGLGYLLAAGCFFWSRILERTEHYRKISWGILGGAWGLLYLSTYAMYFIPVTKIISSAAMEIFLLALVSGAAVFFNLKYKNQTVTALTYLLAFLTLGLGGLNWATAPYWFLLVLSIVYIAQRLEWQDFLFCGILGSYLTYMLVNQLAELACTQLSRSSWAGFKINFTILTVNWVVFTLGLVFSKNFSMDQEKHIMRSFLTNTSGCLFFGLQSFSILNPGLLDPSLKFWFVLTLAGLHGILAWIWHRREKSRLVAMHTLIAFSLAAYSAVLEFPRICISLVWILETTMLFVLGIVYRERIYRIAGTIFGLVVMGRLLLLDLESHLLYQFFGIPFKHSIILFSFAAVCAFAFDLLVNSKKAQELPGEEREAYAWIFPGVGTFLVGLLLWKETSGSNLALALSLQGLMLILAGFLLENRILRYYSCGVYAFVCLAMFPLFWTTTHDFNLLLSSLLNVTVFLGVSLLLVRQKIKTGHELEADVYEKIFPFLATGILLFLCADRVAPQSLTLVWTLQAVLLWGIGFVLEHKILRFCAALGLMTACCRLFLYDLHARDSIQKTLNILVTGLTLIVFPLALGKKKISAIGPTELEGYERIFPIGATLIFIFFLDEKIAHRWLTLAWTIQGIVMLGLGFLFAQKTFRFCALGVLGLAFCRIFFIELSAINTIYKIIAFIFMGMIFVGVSLLYSKIKVKE